MVWTTPSPTLVFCMGLRRSMYPNERAGRCDYTTHWLLSLWLAKLTSRATASMETWSTSIVRSTT